MAAATRRPSLSAGQVARVSSDEVGSFHRLYQAFWSSTVLGALEVLDSQIDAEDAAQSVFVRLYRNGGWCDIQHPTTYFRHAGHREALDIMRRGAHYLSFGDLREGLSGVWIDPLTSIYERELRILLETELAKLPKQCSRVCQLKWLEDLSYREIAARLNTTRKAVEKQVARGKSLLRNSRLAQQLSSFVDGGG